MWEVFLQLIILFFVIFDPLASFAVFFSATSSMKKKQRDYTALLSVLVATSVSFAFLILGDALLLVLNTTLNEFRVASGIVLGILGVQMALGNPPANLGHLKSKTGKAIAAIIGTPMITGPAAITAIIICVNDFGRVITGAAMVVVLVFTGVLLYKSDMINRLIGDTAIKVLTTILGVITLAWGVRFVVDGLASII